VTESEGKGKTNPDVVSRRVGGEVVLVNLKTNRIFTLSPTGSRFWELYEAGGDRAAIEAQLLEEFDVDREQLSREVDQLLEQLRQAQVVGHDAS
jgi:hypothetical protein